MIDHPRSSRHVMIYGPPAAGKLTVARLLADRYGLRVLDNHITVDAALRLFAFGTPDFGRLVERLRVDLLEAAADAAVDIVSTFVYAHPVDARHVDRLVAASERWGAVVTLVQLLPSAAALESRIGAPSRVGTQKITDPVALQRLEVDYDLRTPARSDDLVIDNTDLSPAAVADLIATHVGLERVDGAS